MNGKSEYQYFCEDIEAALKYADQDQAILTALRDKLYEKGRITRKNAAFNLDDAATNIGELKKYCQSFYDIIQGRKRLDLEHPARVPTVQASWKNLDQAEILRHARYARRCVVQFIDGLYAKVKGSEWDEERSTCLVAMHSAWTALDRHIQMLESGCLRKDRRVPFTGQPQLRLVAGGRANSKAGEEVRQ